MPCWLAFGKGTAPLMHAYHTCLRRARSWPGGLQRAVSWSLIWVSGQILCHTSLKKLIQKLCIKRHCFKLFMKIHWGVMHHCGVYRLPFFCFLLRGKEPCTLGSVPFSVPEHCCTIGCCHLVGKCHQLSAEMWDKGHDNHSTFEGGTTLQIQSIVTKVKSFTGCEGDLGAKGPSGLKGKQGIIVFYYTESILHGDKQRTSPYTT